MKILVVEDDESIRNLLTIIFENKGHEVYGASNGKEAITKMDGVDSIITDLHMPELSGNDFAKAARNANPQAKIILCFSPIGGINNIEPDCDLFDRILQKPIRPEEIIGVFGKKVSCARS